jgi:outer membrane protein OmpA-like peptidoglycan-associated protein
MLHSFSTRLVVLAATVLALCVSCGGATLEPRTVASWPPEAKRYALIVGVDEYLDGGITKLDGADNDARAIAGALKQYAAFPDAQVRVLTSDANTPTEKSSKRNILRSLVRLLQEMPNDGLLVFAFSGHGQDEGVDSFLLPNDADITDGPYLLRQSVVDVAEVREEIRRAHVRQVIMLIDACRDEPVKARGNGDNRMSAQYARSFELRNTGVEAWATLYATDEQHRAYEDPSRKQGFFSVAFVDGLKGAAADDQGRVTLGSLIGYVEKRVPTEVLRALGTDVQQKPHAIVEGYLANDLVLSVLEAGARPPATVQPPPPGSASGEHPNSRKLPSPGPMPPDEDWAGVYFNATYGYLHIVTSAGGLTGRWKSQDGSHWGEMRGTTDGNVARFTWTEYAGSTSGPLFRSGTGYFVYRMQDKMALLDGRYSVLGSDDQGNWDCVKQRLMKPNLEAIGAPAPGDAPKPTEPPAPPKLVPNVDLSKTEASRGLVKMTSQELTLKQQIQFALDSAVILPESFPIMQEIVHAMQGRPGVRFEVQGHTDNSGTPEHNKTLSEQRATMVRALLVDAGIDSARLVAKGYGQERPLVPNVTPANRAKNRRIQFIVLQ